ncbi:hypothetical protein E8E13_003780 [Curvularia kusanoi]|uniref:Uncharacterized protein n=1 Tax=Curvularia kusanoi TaxID=90978 RepID=A0A9P4W7L0_CURKU|nr:hypothetical protein E8E13_003780 [Curvularia kusanoi]
MSYSAHHSDEVPRRDDAKVTQRPQFQNIPMKLREMLRDAAKNQERLSESREGLIIERQRLVSSRSQVRVKRLEIRDAEASLMSILRTYFNDFEKPPPESLFESYNRVDQLRDELGVIEEEFLLAERKLAGSEWEFQEKENDFYQFELLDIIEDATSEAAPLLHDHGQIPTNEERVARTASPFARPYKISSDYTSDSESPILHHQHVLPPPSLGSPQTTLSYPWESAVQRSGGSPPVLVLQPPQARSTQSDAEQRDYKSVMRELVALRESFEALRHERANDLVVNDDDYDFGPGTLSVPLDIGNTAQRLIDPEETPFFKILGQISDREVEARRLKNEAMFNDIQFLAIPRRRSDPTGYADPAPMPSIFMGRALTETAMPMYSDRPRAKGRLRDWLLAQLREDPLQRRIYRNISMQEGLESPDGETWEDRASSYWDIDHASDDDGGNTITRATSHEADALPLVGPAARQTESLSSLCNTQTKLGVFTVPSIIIAERHNQGLEHQRSPSVSQQIDIGTIEKAVSHKLGKRQQDSVDIQAILESSSICKIPVITRTPADDVAEQQQRSYPDSGVEDVFTQQQRSSNGLKGGHCSGTLSDVFPLNIRDSPRSMTEDGKEKLPESRFSLSRLISNFGHHRRTRSASCGRDVRHDMFVGAMS